jgi:acyl carrier protein
MPDNQAQFQDALLAFINHQLPQIHKPKKSPTPPGLEANPDTLLFETGLIDSLGIVHLICFVEEATGRPIPTRMVVMKHFKTPAAITQTFWNHEGENQ